MPDDDVRIDSALTLTFFVIISLEISFSEMNVNPSVRAPVNVMYHVIFSSNHHFSAVSWNIFIQFEVIVYETLFLLLVYLLLRI